VAAAAEVSVSGSITGLPDGTHTIGPVTVTSSAANGSVTQTVLQSGFNEITVPTTPAPSGCVVVFDSTNTASHILKGVTGDTGIKVSETDFLVLTFDPADLPTSFGITAGATETGLVTVITFF
jgi:hypothetical protein